MTPEELAAIEEYMMLLQSDPMARATNDWGQGSGFLSAPKKPTSWARVGDKNDLMTDLFRTTQTYMSDYIPDLFPEAKDPGQFTGFRSDQADLYRNNPAYAQLEAAMAEGASFDEAVSLIAQSPEFAGQLPKTERGQVDLSAFRNSAETYVSERAREGREFDVYDAERQAYEDYVNPKSQWEINNPDDSGPVLRDETVRPTLAEGRPVKLFGRTLHPGVPQTGPRYAPQAQGSSPTVASLLGRSRGIDQESLGQAFNQPPQSTAAKSPTRNAAGGRQKSATRTKDTRTATDRAAGNKAYNQSAQAVHDFQKKKQQAQINPSKQQENLAKKVAFYNMLMYGE